MHCVGPPAPSASNIADEKALADEEATTQGKKCRNPLVRISPLNHRERSHFDGDFMPRRGRKFAAA